MGTTTFLLKRDDTGKLELRHGHAANISDKVQWHRAEAYHRNDPGGHGRENSWDTRQVVWSPQSLPLTEMQRAQLIDEACSCHESARLGFRREPDYDSILGAAYVERAPASPPPAPPDPAPEDAPSIYSAPPTPTPAREAIPADELNTLSGLAERVDDLEGLAVVAQQRIDTLDRSSLDTSNAVARVEGRLMPVENKLMQVATDHAALTTRVDTLENVKSREIVFVVNNGTATTSTSGIRHFKFPALLALASALSPCDRNIWISGPAGSGKTSAAAHLAEALGLPFEYSPSLDTSYKLSGFIDAGGRYHSTQFRRIYEHGGVMLLDEIDGGSAGALLEINGATSSDYGSFPDGMVKRHDNCYLLGSANTWGFGGDANYVGRNKLDAAFLDRWITLAWPYDPYLERIAAGGTSGAGASAPEQLYVDDTNANYQPDLDRWVDTVQAVRQRAHDMGAQIVISPRASIKGAQLLRARLHPKIVVEAIFGRYRTHSAWAEVGKAAEDYAKAAVTRTPAKPPAPASNPALTITMPSSNGTGDGDGGYSGHWGDPMTEKQFNLIKLLCARNSKPVPEMRGWTKHQASTYIDNMKAAGVR